MKAPPLPSWNQNVQMDLLIATQDQNISIGKAVAELVELNDQVKGMRAELLDILLDIRNQNIALQKSAAGEMGSHSGGRESSRGKGKGR